MPRAAGSSRRCWSRSASSAATRPRWAPPSAKISSAARSAARRCIGAKASSPATPPCPKAPEPCQRRPRAGANSRADWRRSASSRPPTASGCRRCLKPGQRLVSREGRALALGRLHRQRRRADRRRAAAGAEEPAGRARRRGASHATASCARPKTALAHAEQAHARGERGRAQRASGRA